MTDSKSPSSLSNLAVWAFAAVFFLATTSASWFRWANFQYRTFDLAYYVQAIWQLIHGRFDVTVENVPLLGNHVEPIVILFAPLFALVRHPMLFVVVQNAAVAAMGPIAYHFARRFFTASTAALLSIALLLAPAASYIALHEFHPEALTAPLILLLIYSRAAGRTRLHWFCFAGVLACKENMALLLVAYCIVFLFLERGRGSRELVRWYGAPLFLAGLWFIICARLITPALNSGNIDYLGLYDRLGKNGPDIIWNAVTKPQLIGGSFLHALVHGNLFWALLLPFVALPLLRPRWIIIALPILLQHLLSWRSSEWNIYFHYAAPLLPLFWIASVEALAMVQRRLSPAAVVKGRAPASLLATRKSGVAGAPPSIQPSSAFVPLVAGSLVAACIIAQCWIGPAPAIASDLMTQGNPGAETRRKQAFVSQIPADASVVAPLPYLSHLAMREKLYSLHYVLKGLKTLSRERYQPPPLTDFVLVDYSDSATFDAAAGFYHPEMRTAAGTIIPSSDRLLYEFLSAARWNSSATNWLTLFHKTGGSPAGSAVNAKEEDNAAALFNAGGNELRSIRFGSPTGAVNRTKEVGVELTWKVAASRTVFPWMMLAIGQERQTRPVRVFPKGLCAIEVADGNAAEHWAVDLSGLPDGTYWAQAIFVDNSKRAWAETHGGGGDDLRGAMLAPPVSLGPLVIGGPAK